MAIVLRLLFLLLPFCWASAVTSPITGSSQLFTYDKTLQVSEEFQDLLEDLQEFGFLELQDDLSLFELSDLLQKPLGEGGLARKKGVERWEMEPIEWSADQEQRLRAHLTRLGFIVEKKELLGREFSHVILFGSRVERMAVRIQKTLEVIENEGLYGKSFFLLGSSRSLVSEEVELLQALLSRLAPDNDSELSTLLEEKPTEGTAYLILWSLMAPSDYQARTELLESSSIPEGSKRATTVETVEMLVPHIGECATFFSLSEQPYLRLSDTLRAGILLAKGDLFSKNYTFSSVHPSRQTPEKLEILLDEVSKNVYLITQTFRRSLK